MLNGQTPIKPVSICMYSDLKLTKSLPNTRRIKHTFSKRCAFSSVLVTTSLELFNQISVDVLNQKFSTEAVKSLFSRDTNIYNAIKQFEKFTGGGGDGDLTADSDDELSRRMDRARARGFHLDGLTVEIYEKWMSNGWFDLWDAR